MADAGEIADARTRCFAWLRMGTPADRERAVHEAEQLVLSHPHAPLAHITLGAVLSDVRASGAGEAGDEGAHRLERAWVALREALALGADEGQRAFCAGSLLALEARLEELARAGGAAAAAALERALAAEPPTPPVAAVLVAESLPAAPMRVTLLSGFLGAGKTTLLRHILTGSHGRRVAVVVNDMAELNIDSQLVRAHVAEGEPLIELTNGCICCTLRTDLVEQLAALGRSGAYELCVVESTGVSEPLAVAQAFALADAAGVSLCRLAQLDTMVTVIDASAFLGDLTAGDSLQTRRMAVSPTDARDLATLMVEQLEVADVVLVNKVDLVPEGRVAQLEAFVRATNRTARVLRAVRAAVPLAEVVGTGRFDLAAASMSAGWVRELMGEHLSETEAYGIVSTAFVRPRPFDAARLWALVAGDPPALRGVLRSKGYAWVAQRPAFVLEWQTAGVDTDCRVAGTWAAAGAGAAAAAGTYGARRNELVFIGMRLDTRAIEALLEAALSTDAELGALEAARLPDGELGEPAVGGALGPLPDGMTGMFENAADALGTGPASAEAHGHAAHSHDQH